MFVHAVKGEELTVSDKESNTQLTGENGKQYGDSNILRGWMSVCRMNCMREETVRRQLKSCR